MGPSGGGREPQAGAGQVGGAGQVRAYPPLGGSEPGPQEPGPAEMLPAHFLPGLLCPGPARPFSTEQPAAAELCSSSCLPLLLQPPPSAGLSARHSRDAPRIPSSPSPPPPSALLACRSGRASLFTVPWTHPARSCPRAFAPAVPTAGNALTSPLHAAASSAGAALQGSWEDLLRQFAQSSPGRLCPCRALIGGLGGGWRWARKGWAPSIGVLQAGQLETWGSTSAPRKGTHCTP